MSFSSEYNIGTDQIGSSHIPNFITDLDKLMSNKQKFPNPVIQQKANIPEGFTEKEEPNLSLFVFLMVILIIISCANYNMSCQINESLKLLTSIIASKASIN